MRLGSQDAFASARGEAFVATADNPSAIYYNPAGISQIEGTQVRGGIYGIYLDPTFEPPTGAPNSGKTYHIDQNYAAVPQFFFSHTPQDSKWSFGLGIYSPYGANVTWPQDTGFRAVAIEGDVKYFRFNPVVAYKILPQLSLAAGALIDYGDIKLEQGLLGNQAPFINFFRFKGDGWTAGYNVGLLWQPHEMISFGTTFRSSTEITMDGKTEFRQQPIIPATIRAATADFEFPFTVVCGISFRPSPKWNFEFDADYTDWNSFDRVVIRQQTPPPFPVQQNIPVTLAWESSWIFEFGVTRYLDNDWHLSAGYIYNQNSVPDAFYSPLAADVDRHFFAIGGGKKGKRFDVDVTYQFGYGAERTVTGSQPSSQPGFFAGQTADGTYKFISHAIFVSVGMRF
jgi:long-chain fatty acid transport protein